MVERNLAKVEVASSRLVSRSKYEGKPPLPFFLGHGAIAKRLCTGLQIRVGRFDSGSRLHCLAFMAQLNTQANFHARKSDLRGDPEPGDAFYETLMQAHQGLSDSQSQLLNARLILVLANHIGHLEVLNQAIEVARKDV